MYYILIIVVLHGHIHEHRYKGGAVFDGFYPTQSDCQSDIKRIRSFTVKPGAKVYAACVLDNGTIFDDEDKDEDRKGKGRAR